MQHSFHPENPEAGKEFIVIANWVDRLTGNNIEDAEWLASKEKPAYLWVWDHEPSHDEIHAYQSGFKNISELPQQLIPLQWDGEKYHGSLSVSEVGPWYITVGTVVPAAMQSTLEADSDYVGQVDSFDVMAKSPESLERGLSSGFWLWIGSAVALAFLGSSVVWLKVTRTGRAQRRTSPVTGS